MWKTLLQSNCILYNYVSSYIVSCARWFLSEQLENSVITIVHFLWALGHNNYYYDKHAKNEVRKYTTAYIMWPEWGGLIKEVTLSEVSI